VDDEARKRRVEKNGSRPRGLTGKITDLERSSLAGGESAGRTGGCTGPSFIERTGGGGRGEEVKIRRGRGKR